jgi:hypothetical protein
MYPPLTPHLTLSLLSLSSFLLHPPRLALFRSRLNTYLASAQTPETDFFAFEDMLPELNLNLPPEDLFGTREARAALQEMARRNQIMFDEESVLSFLLSSLQTSWVLTILLLLSPLSLMQCDLPGVVTRRIVALAPPSAVMLSLPIWIVSFRALIIYHLPANLERHRIATYSANSRLIRLEMRSSPSRRSQTNASQFPFISHKASQIDFCFFSTSSNSCFFSASFAAATLFAKQTGCDG